MKIRKLRIYEVALSRNGKPSDATSQKIIADVDANFPAKTFELNTESSQILAYFNAPSAVPKTMTVIARTKIYQENFAYRYNIRQCHERMDAGVFAKHTSSGSPRTTPTTRSLASIASGRSA